MIKKNKKEVKKSQDIRISRDEYKSKEISLPKTFIEKALEENAQFSLYAKAKLRKTA
jgi:hypothetical protein